MESVSSRLVVSVGMGGAIFIGFILFWFLRVYFKKRTAPEHSVTAAALAARRNPWEEKRSQPRPTISWHAAFGTPRGVARAQLKDISPAGAFVVCADPLPLSERFHIEIDLPEQGPLELKAEVVWSNVNMPEDRIINRGMGIRFIDNEEEKRKTLSQAVAEVTRSAAANA